MIDLSNPPKHVFCSRMVSPMCEANIHRAHWWQFHWTKRDGLWVMTTEFAPNGLCDVAVQAIWKDCLKLGMTLNVSRGMWTLHGRRVRPDERWTYEPIADRPEWNL